MSSSRDRRVHYGGSTVYHIIMASGILEECTLILVNCNEIRFCGLYNILTYLGLFS